MMCHRQQGMSFLRARITRFPFAGELVHGISLLHLALDTSFVSKRAHGSRQLSLERDACMVLRKGHGSSLLYLELNTVLSCFIRSISLHGSAVYASIGR